MANRLTKGRGLFGAVRVNGVIAGNTRTDKTTVTSLTDTAETLTAAQVVTNGGLLVGTPTASRAKTIPTGTLTCGALKGYAVGDTFEVNVVNLAAATHPLVITAGTDATIVGSATVAAATSATFKVRVSAANTVVWYRTA
jgi:hypothetical protein